MAHSKITIKELAEKMQLSISTISRALHDHPSIGKKTTNEVKKLAKKLGYFPNSIASNLRRNKTQTIGVIAPRIDIYFHSHVISGIEEVAYKTGYNVTIFQSHDSLEREIKITQILQSKMVDGVIACIGLETTDCSHFAKFDELNVPLVFYDRVSKHFDVSKVVIDDFEAAFKATKHLIQLGRRNIFHIAGPQSADIFKARQEGYKAALIKYNIAVNHKMIRHTAELSYEEGAGCAKKILASGMIPDGIFCSNDYTAIDAIQVFKKAGYQIPNDIAVVGFSNYPISKILDPTLTTIDDRAFEMGQAAGKLIIRQIEDPDHTIATETIVIKTNLVVRDSTTIDSAGA
ncbi:LacI family transcriptional regulator [Niabella ginsenosidivorans]|uniref:LacI family transcriptional regulator n=1 Tax=Niabella ginsenosidivorans TaxID=1176587 RepID=A0A1A9HZM0_9BACT|nr:LacI family DNA-binding transcriptional regulator [Niabella ginsenosidivorans]ANH80713.1 LacI family transcriptional regulator [Niabella ginsenosidivorans]